MHFEEKRASDGPSSGTACVYSRVGGHRLKHAKHALAAHTDATQAFKQPPPASRTFRQKPPMEQAVHGPAQVQDVHAVASAGAVVGSQQQHEATSAGERYGTGWGCRTAVSERQSVSSFDSRLKPKNMGAVMGGAEHSLQCIAIIWLTQDSTARMPQP